MFHRAIDTGRLMGVPGTGTEPRNSRRTVPGTPTADGNFVALDGDGQGAVTLNFSCGDCHRNKSANWIAGHAKNFHQRGTKSRHNHK